MNRFSTSAALSEETSVALLPLPRIEPPAVTNHGSASGVTIGNRILDELGHSLEELARRARQAGPAEDGTILMMAGCRRGVGCTTLALALARVAAREHGVLLIDGDFQQPDLTTGLVQRPFAPLEPSRGLQEGLDIRPLPDPMGQLETMFDPSAMRAWQRRLRQEYALSVLDGGAVGDSAERWAPWVDVVVLVCDSGQKLAGDWDRASRRLEECGAHVLGIVEMFS